MSGGININIFKLLGYKHYQKTFCKNYIKRAKQIEGYNDYLIKHDNDSNKESFFEVSIYDVLDNRGVKKLVNGIYKMKRKKKLFKVETFYRNRKLNNTNYINIFSSSRGWARIGDISFNKHKWLSKISITHTANNSSEIIVEYNFQFKKVIDSSFKIHLFVMDELKNAKKELYFHSFANKNIIKNAKFEELYECDNAFFGDILQSYICEYFYTKYGTKYKLPMEYCFSVDNFEQFREKLLQRKSPLQIYIHDNRSELICVDSFLDDRYTVSHYCKAPHFPNPILLHFFSDMSMELYLQTFYDIEKYELEKHMRKYLNSRKRFVKNKDIKWLIRKIRNISEQKNEIEEIEKKKARYAVYKKDEWYLYFDGKKQKETFIMFPEKLNRFEQIYTNHLEYLKSIASTQNDQAILIISLLAFIASVIGILLTLFK